MTVEQRDRSDVWYDVQPGGVPKVCERSYYDEQFERGASQGLSVSVNGVVHNFVPAHTLALNGGPTHLSYAKGDDGSFHVLAGGEVVADFPSHDWFELRTRQLRASG